MANMRPFNAFEQRNLEFLVNHNVEFTQVEITATGLKKSILDSTATMRTFFLGNGIHNYGEQLQGQEHKASRRALILTETSQKETTAVFYRPNTKKGDPRMWIYGLGAFSAGSDIYVLFVFDTALCAVNITQVDIEKCCNSPVVTPLRDIIKVINQEESLVAEELLAKFRSIEGQWLESEITADTGIGRTIETFLGISMNCDKAPDYKGIEIKSLREKRSSKKSVLFTKAPNWDISALKSGRDIVEEYGYYTEDGKKTYQNTVRCMQPNSQMLLLNVNHLDELLELQAQQTKVKDVAVWRLAELHKRLLSKHHETFWVEVENEKSGGREYFRLKQIEHTKNPNVGQFDVLIERGVITVDLLLCRPSGNGDTYSFKIKKTGMPLLFPQSVVYKF